MIQWRYIESRVFNLRSSRIIERFEYSRPQPPGNVYQQAAGDGRGRKAKII